MDGVRINKYFIIVVSINAILSWVTILSYYSVALSLESSLIRDLAALFACIIWIYLLVWVLPPLTA